MKITKSQEKAIARIKRDFETLHGHCQESYELKKFDHEFLSEEVAIISLIGEMGLIGDEGTMAQVFGRDRIHVFISPRGKIYYYGPRGGKRTYRTIYETALHQR